MTKKEVQVLATQQDGSKESGLPWTILRPTMFMQLTMMFADSIKNDGAFYAPLKDAKVAMIDIRDIVGCAMGVLTGSGHEGKTYELTGPNGVSFAEVASSLSELLNKDVKYVAVPPDAAREAMKGMGMPDFLARDPREWTNHSPPGEAGLGVTHTRGRSHVTLSSRRSCNRLSYRPRTGVLSHTSEPRPQAASFTP